jgi:hypothetical protein
MSPSLLLLAVSAHAASLESTLAGSQPLLEESLLLERLAPWCGVALATEDLTERTGERLHQLETCDVLLIPELGLLHVDAHARPSGASRRFDAATLARVEADDLALLQALGFDATELASRGSHQLAAEDKRRGHPVTVPAPRYLGTKTLVERQLDGIPVLTHRAVVSRDQDGNLQRLNASWPTIDAATVVWTSDAPEADAVAARASGERPLWSLREVIAFPEIEAGFATVGVRCLEAVHLGVGVEGDTKPLATYFLDGVPVDPREAAR